MPGPATSSTRRAPHPPRISTPVTARPPERNRILSAAAVYAGGSWVVLEVVGTLRENLGLPRWLFVAALALVLIGFVVVLATAWVQSRPGMAERAASEEVPEAWELDPSDLVASLKAGRLPHLTWARALTGGAAACLVLFGLAGLYVVLQDRGRAFLPREADAAMIPGLAVMPFTTSGDNVEVLREGMVDLLSTNLDGVGGLRTIDSRTVLARWREGGLDEGSDLDRILRAAQATGARLALVGSVVELGSAVRLDADLYDVEDGAVVGDGRAEGPADSILALVDRLSVDLVGEILAQQDSNRLGPGSISALTTSSLPALYAYLEGEALYRAGDFYGAVTAYEHAINEDSAFAMPYYRLSHAIGWTGGPGESEAYGARARELASRLPPRDRDLLTASDDAMRNGSLDAIDLLEEMSRTYPDDPEVWYELGEVYNHLGAAAQITVDAMIEAFEVAIGLDSAFAPAYIHAIEGVASQGDLDRMGRLLEGFRAHVPPGAFHLARLDFMYRAMSGEQGWEIGLREMSPDQLVELLINLDDADIGTEPLRRAVLAEIVSRVGRGEPMGPASADVWYRIAAQSLHRVGQREAALEMVGRLSVPGPAARVLVTMALDGVDVSLNDLDFEPDEGDAFGTVVAAALEVSRNRWDAHARHVARLRELATTDQLRAMADALEAWGWWARGDAERAAPVLQSALATGPPFGMSDPVHDILTVVTELVLIELGRPAAALPYVLSHRAQPHAKLRAARLYEELGRVQQARDAYRAVLEVWDEADEAYPPKVEAERRLAALS